MSWRIPFRQLKRHYLFIYSILRVSRDVIVAPSVQPL